MTVSVKYRLIYALTLLVSCFCFLSTPAAAQEVELGNGIVIDKSVHNFGDILMSDGPVECTFTVLNKGKKPVVIYNVVTSCGCTEAKWTRNPIKPGESGKITVTYTNDEGAYAFSKSVTAYISNIKRPTVLRLKGKTHGKKPSLESSYPLRFGPLGLEHNKIRCGNMVQGQMRSNTEIVANLSDHPIQVEFADLTKNLTLKVQPNPIPARNTARLHFCITSDPEVWGNNDYTAIPVIDGRRMKSADGSPLIFQAFTIQDFSQMTPEESRKAAAIEVEMSSFDFGSLQKGKPIKAWFHLSNSGDSPLVIRKIDADQNGLKHNEVPTLQPGESFDLYIELDTCCVPFGDYLALVTLTTNSPQRPYVNLFVSGSIEQ